MKDDTVIDQQPDFNEINLVVRDMEATVAFYRQLGLTIPETEPEWNRHHRQAIMPDGIELDFDSVEFAQMWNRGWKREAGGGMGVLGFRLRSREAVDQLYAELTGAGYQGQQPPYDAFWGSRFAIVSDPDGNAVGLKSPADPSRRSPPTPP
ncbi:MAG: VOC family protein [Dehalococcoidia bacterium]